MSLVLLLLSSLTTNVETRKSSSNHEVPSSADNNNHNREDIPNRLIRRFLEILELPVPFKNEEEEISCKVSIQMIKIV